MTLHTLAAPGSNGAAPQGDPLRERLFLDRYALKDADGRPIESTPEEMWRRVADAIAAVEPTPELRETWRGRFFEALQGFRFVPGGRILAGAGSGHAVTFFNCYVLPSPEDSRGGILDNLKVVVEVMARGGGVGVNLSTLRPRGSHIRTVNGTSSGPVAWAELYSVATGDVVQQGGCFGPNQRIATDHGLLRAVDLADRIDRGDAICACTHEGPRRISHAFRNGHKEVLRVRTARGFTVDVTREHRMGVLQDGRLTTRPLQDLSVGDEVVLFLGEPIAGAYVQLGASGYERSVMSTRLNEKVRLPEVLDERLAYFLGYFHGDGSVHWGRKVPWRAPAAIKLVTADAYPAIREHLLALASDLFGVAPVVENRANEGCSTLILYSRILVDWLERQGLMKARSDSVRVPEVIFRSPSSVMGAFVAGYFDADGSDRGAKGGYGFDSVSPQMLRDIQQILAANGILGHLRVTDRAREGWRSIHRLAVTGAEFKARMSSFVSLARKNRENAGARNHGNHYPRAVWSNLGIPGRYYQGVWDSTQSRISYRALCRVRDRLIGSGQVELAERVDQLLRTIPDRIATVEPAGSTDVYDFEVEDAHMLSGDGFYTSNSRRGALMLMLDDDHPDVEEFVTAKTDLGRLHHANLSVCVSDAFMEAVRTDAGWALKWQGRVSKVVRARDLWSLICRSAWRSAEPGVVFIDRANALNNLAYCETIRCTNPCAEQLLGPWHVCNLGALNLTAFVREGRLDLDGLAEHARVAVRFLDDVIDANHYFFPENEEAQKGVRRIGLGTMGLADALIALRVRYGSAESLGVVERIYRTIRDAAYDASADLAIEKGTFPRFDRRRFIERPFVARLPERLQAKILTRGLRNGVLLCQAPTGCLVPGSMVSTDCGLLPIEALADPRGDQWQPIQVRVASEGGARPAESFYVNGQAPTMRVRTKYGYVLQGTANHRVRVLEDGVLVWKRLCELEPGAVVPIVPAGFVGSPAAVELDTALATAHFNSRPVRLPQRLSPDLAYLVGYFLGDGSLKRRTLRLAVSSRDPEALLVRLLREVFGIEPAVTEDARSRTLRQIEVHSSNVVAFWWRNGFAKQAPTDQHAGKGYVPHVPLSILRSNDPEIYGAFLAGLFDADASLKFGYALSWTTSDLAFHDQVKAMLLTLGVVTRSDVGRSALSQKPAYRLCSTHVTAAMRLRAALPRLQRVKPKEVTAPRWWTRCDSIPITPQQRSVLLSVAVGQVEKRWVSSLTRQTATRSRVADFVRSHRAELTGRGLDLLIRSVAEDIYYDRVAAVEDGGIQPTYDLSVPETHSYVANGFISHNTTSLLAGVSSGIEPIFDFTLVRRDRLGERVIEHPAYRAWTAEHPGEPLPPYLVTADQLSPEEHVRVQATIQEFTDSSISKTVNAPADHTVEDVERLYRLAYELGCKGVTYYRDGCREAVLHHGADAARPAEGASSDAGGQLRPRPPELAGTTRRAETPLGTAFVTVNRTEAGEPFEVFVNVGKAGSDVAALAEAIGRLCSLCLRLPGGMAAAARVREIVDQLGGIGGAESLGFGPGRVRSLPDAIARVLAGGETAGGEGITCYTAAPPDARGDLCPACGAAALVSEGGCRTCRACGHSRC